MNKEVIKLLKSLDLLDEEIEMCFNNCPGLITVDLERAKENLKVLVNAGYPKIDLGVLISANPNILVYNPAILKTALNKFKDVEETLKNNPYAI